MNAPHPRVPAQRSALAGWRVPLWIFVGIVFALLGQRLYSLNFAERTGVVVIEAERYTTRLEESPAERLLPTLLLDLYDGDGEILVDGRPLMGPLPARVEVQLRGEAQRKAFEAGRLRARLHHPGLDDANLNLEPSVVDTGVDTLRYELRIDRTEDFYQREMRTYVAVRDQYGRAVRDLRAVLGIPLRERPREPGVYDVSLLVRDLLFLLEANRKYFVEVRSEAEQAPARHVLELDPRWFAGDGKDPRVVQVQLEEGSETVAATREEAASTPAEPEADPEPASDPVAATPTPPRAEPEGSPVTTPPPPSPATLVVLAQPLEASIRLDGGARELPSGQAIEGLSPGRHRVEVSLEGYVTENRTVRLESGRTEVLSVSLAKAAPQVGTLEIRVSPFADYWVDGRKVGTNVGRIELEVAAGAHAVRVEHPLFEPHEWRSAEVEPGETTTLRHDFDASRSFGSLRVTVRGGWGRIYVDGKDTGLVSPNVVREVPVGRRVVTLHSAEGEIPGSARTLVVREGQTQEVSYELDQEGVR